ncbi:MAG: GIY-YIG nuclease family protein [Clostridia bacterium]|nr:GIY-YIG nuclease family protein [Clostridia bacterium]
MDYYVYILANKMNTVIYTGVTNDLLRRVYEHKMHLDQNSFTAKYDVTRLVFYEVTSDVRSAIEREKQIKSWSRAKKNILVETMNPKWEDLWESIRQ